jgi:hypothetical protein
MIVEVAEKDHLLREIDRVYSVVPYRHHFVCLPVQDLHTARVAGYSFTGIPADEISVLAVVSGRSDIEGERAAKVRLEHHSADSVTKKSPDCPGPL